MLLLTRKADQRILIGGSIRITVLEARGPVVRLGIEAPDGLPIRCGDDRPACPDRPQGGIDRQVGSPARRERAVAIAPSRRAGATVTTS